MHVLLFLAVLGVVLWAAPITSAIGASYTSVSFLTTFHPGLERRRNLLVVGIIAVSTLVFVFAGAFNGLVLPIGMAVVRWLAARRPARDDLPGVAAVKSARSWARLRTAASS